MAASKRLTCICRHVLPNLRRVERISVVYGRQHLPTAVKNAQVALYSTVINEDTTSHIPQVPSTSPQVTSWPQGKSSSSDIQKPGIPPHRKNWPTSSFWKKYDYGENRFLMYKGKEIYSFDEMNFSEVPQYSPRIFYSQMECKDPTVPWSEKEAVAVFELLSTARIGLTNQSRLGWVDYLVQQMKSKGPLPVSVYNAYLKCYLNLNHPFDPVQILVEMQKTGVGPDKHTMALLIKQYVFMKDINGARSVYEHTDGDESLKSQESILNMILGYVLLGEDEEVVKLVDTLRDTYSDSNLSELLYPTLFLGNALLGNESRLNKLGLEIDDAKVLNIQSILDMIVVCSHHNATTGAEFLITFLGRKSNYFVDSVTTPLISLMCNGHHELAFKLYSQLQRPSGVRFYISASRAELPPDIVYHYTRKMEENGYRECNFVYYVECLLRNKDSLDLMKKALPVLKRNGLEIRSFYLWGIINDIKENGNLNDIGKILPYYKFDSDTQDYFLYPCVKKFKATSGGWLKLCKDTDAFDNEELKSLLLSYAVHIKDTEVVKKVLEKGIQLQKILGEPDIIRLCRSLAETWEDSDIFLEFLKSVGVELEDVAVESQDLDEEYRNLIKADPAPKSQVIELAAMLLKAKRFRDAKSLFRFAMVDAEDIGNGLCDCRLFDIPSTDLNKDFAKSLMYLMTVKGYFNTWTKDVQQRMQRIQFAAVVIQNYLKFLIESGDDTELIEYLKKHAKRYNLETITVYSALKLLHEQSRSETIQKVLEYLKDANWTSDRISLCVAVSLIENGKMEKAGKAFEQAPFRAESGMRVFYYLQAEGKFEVMEKLYTLLTEKYKLSETIKNQLMNRMSAPAKEMVETSTDSKKTDEPLRKAGQDETSQCLETPVENTVDDKHMENSERTKKTEQIGSEV